MNIVDISILGIIALCVLLGTYNGFFVTGAKLVAQIVSWVIAVVTAPVLSTRFAEGTQMKEILMYYSDGASNISIIEDRFMNVASLDGSWIERFISESSLPSPFDDIMRNVLANQSLPDLTTIGEYFDNVVVNLLINAFSLFLIFIICYLIFSIIIAIAKNLFKLPVLKQFDMLFGGVMGFVIGIIITFFIFGLIPVMMLILPVPQSLVIMINTSSLGEFFINYNIFTNLLTGLL